MYRFVLFFVLILNPLSFFIGTSSEKDAKADSECFTLYERICGETPLINYEAFRQAIAASHLVETAKNHIITLIDFTKPSTEDRFFVFDIKAGKILFKSVVAHGRNSGGNYATSFSNRNGSYQSSPGFYLTGETYQGGNGYSLILNGLEKGINDKARERAIVIHGADYCNPSFITSSGRLGRSFGCPALPHSIAKDVIDTIKTGSLLYIYTDNENYRNQTTFLSHQPAS